MAIRIKVEIDAESRRLASRLANAPALIVEGVRRGMNNANNRVLAHAVRKRFSGRGPFPPSEHRLGHRSRHLKDNINVVDAEVRSAKGLKVSGAIGTNVEYFGVHEFGFEGEVNVKRYTIRRAFGKQGNDFSVLAHKRKMKIPRRAPLTTAIEESAAIYREEFGREIKAALKGKEGGMT